jgi:phage terminase large subunit-like protein
VLHAPLTAAAGPWSTALPDWESRILGGRSIVPDLPLHEARAAKALRIFKQLRCPDVEGTPTYGEICDDWVFDLVRAIFGAFDEDERRRIREYFLLIPKKNGKTSIAAAIMVVACIVNERPDAELLLIAPTIAIAERAFKQAKGIIRLTVMSSGVRLEDLFSVHDHIGQIKNLNPEVPSVLVIKSADDDVVTGSKASVVLVDETHVFASKPKAKGVFLEIRGGMSHPDNKGFFLQITTQSKAAPAGVFDAELKQARAVRDGRLSAPMLPVLYELPQATIADDGWKDPAVWPLVNPHLGRSVDVAFLADQLRKAEEDGTEALALFASQHLNVQIGGAAWGDGWPGARHWDAQGDPDLTLQNLLDRSEVVTVGVDWGGADDLASLAVIGRERDTRRWLHWSMSWARPSVLLARKAIAPALEGFESDGDLAIVPTGEHQAVAAADLCAHIRDSGLLPEQAGIGLDAAGVALLMDELETREMTQPLVTAVQQGWRLQTASQSLPLKLEAGLMQHGAQRIMAWAVKNAKQELRGSNYMVTKAASGAAKIDPLVATFNAAMLMFLNPQAAGGQYLKYSGM